MSDDDVGRRLRGQIPEPRHGYWESIHTKLAAIEAAQDFDEGTDTDVALGRQTDMTNTNPPNVSVLPGESRRPSFLFAAAAALVLILGIGAAALISRSGDDGTTELDVAAEPEGSGSVAAPPTGGQTQTQTTPTPVPADDAVSGVEFGDSPSPVGGTVKKAVLSGPETAVMVVCDQGGFEPFLFTDQGTWIGCRLSAGATAGGESALTDAAFAGVASPVGGTVGRITIPGPQTSVIVECAGGFEPFLYTDQGTWIGCQG